MAVTNKQSGTRVDEVVEGIYRISTPFKEIPGGFSFNQYLIKDDQPLLFHTGPRRMSALTQEAISSILDIKDVRFISFSHFESDECGSLNTFLALAPGAEPLCSRVNAMVNGDCFDRPARTLSDGETLSLGNHRVRWFDTPHLPHAWECGYLLEERTGTLLCGDLFTQGGADLPPVTESDVLGPSEIFRRTMDYFSHTTKAQEMLERLASASPATLACMHGSAWRGDGAGLLRTLGQTLAAD